MLQRVVGILQLTLSPIVVVAAVGQELPQLTDDVIIARDEHQDRGPLGGLAAGFRELRGHTDAVYVSGCDVPLLSPDFIRAITESLGQHEIVVPRDGSYHHPLAAVYRLSVEDRVRKLIDADRLRPFFLFEQSDVREIDVEELRSVDPELLSLRNSNTPDEYQNLLKIAGIQPE